MPKFGQRGMEKLYFPGHPKSSKNGFIEDYLLGGPIFEKKCYTISESSHDGPLRDDAK